MLRSRNHRRTDKFYLDADDGPIVSARVFYAFLASAPTNFSSRCLMDAAATRVSDGRPEMLKRLLGEEEPHELQINKLFSTGPLASTLEVTIISLKSLCTLARRYRVAW